MKISERASATDSQATASRFFGIKSWQHQTTLAAVAVGAFLLGSSQLGELPASASTSGESAAIASDPNAKSAREAKRAERAAAREAKKKERASKSSKSDDRSLAKAKASKGSSGSSVDLGDDDPLEGL
jgi:hypothetical protein